MQPAGGHAKGSTKEPNIRTARPCASLCSSRDRTMANTSRADNNSAAERQCTSTDYREDQQTTQRDDCPPMQAIDAWQGDGSFTRGDAEGIQYSKASSAIGADGLLNVRPDTVWHKLVRPPSEGCLCGQSAVNDISCAPSLLFHEKCYACGCGCCCLCCRCCSCFVSLLSWRQRR